MSAILLDGEIVHYEVIGRGRPIIFLHGWIGSWRYWVPAMQSASSSFRAYALDLWGFGETAHMPGRYSLDQQILLLEQFLREMGMGRVALVGHGLGALASLGLCFRSPEVVDRIMAINCPLDAASVHARMRTGTPGELVEWLLGREPEFDPARNDSGKIDPLAVAQSFNGLATDLIHRIRQLKTPTLFVYGQNDPAITPPDLDWETGLSILIHQLVLDQTGHFPMLDDSARFHRLLTDFLALESGESPRDLQLKEEWRRRVR